MRVLQKKKWKRSQKFLAEVVAKELEEKRKEEVRKNCNIVERLQKKMFVQSKDI